MSDRVEVSISRQLLADLLTIDSKPSSHVGNPDLVAKRLNVINQIARSALGQYADIDGEQSRGPRFDNVSCSSCGEDFGPGNSGFSHCESHAGMEVKHG